LNITARKSLEHLAQEIGVSTSSARRATQLLKLRPYKTTATHVLQPRDSAGTVHFCSWFLQSAVEGEIDPLLAFFSDETWSHLQEYINTQNNRYGSSQNIHLTHEVLLHPVKVGVWCAIIARRAVGSVCFNETINCGRYPRVEGQYFQHLL
jgi:hypothetical protein